MFDNITAQILIYILCFVMVWISAGLVVSAVTELSKSWRLPRFVVSFFLLGVITSLPELSIGVISVLENNPVIMAGNLLGGAIVMFLFIIPLLGVIGNGVKIPVQLDRKQLVFTLIVAVAPAFLTADQRIERWEAIFLIVLYLSLFLFFSFRNSVFEKARNSLTRKKNKGFKHIFKIIIGVIILILASNQIVDSTLFFANILNISPFFVSLIVVSIGTNIPEISIIFRAVAKNKKDVALADYLGSASTNTFLFGALTLLYGQTIFLPNHFLQRFAFLALGLILFYIFSRSKNVLSRKESFLLLLLYFSFVIFEIFVISTSV